MIKKFFGADVIRSPHSADMFFDRAALSRALGVGVNTLDKQLRAMQYDKATGLIFDGAEGARQGWAKYGLDVLIGLSLGARNKSTRQRERYALMIEFFRRHINDLCYDEFASLRGWLLPLDHRQAIMAYVCDVNRYIDIPLKRLRVGAPYHGSMLRNYHTTPRNLSAPEAWITRGESTRVRAIDLAVGLLCEHLNDEREPAELLALIGIDIERGQYTEDDKAHLVESLTQLVL